MKIIVYIIVSGISLFVFRFILGMILLSLFFGIPQTLKLKKDKVLSNDATIKPYITTTLIWTTVILFIFFISSKVFTGLYFIEIIWGFIIAFISSLQLLSKKNYYINISEVLNVQCNHINTDFLKSEPDIETWKTVKDKIDNLKKNASEKDREL